MRKLLLSLSVFVALDFYSQSAADAAVQLSAVVQANPAQITLNWLGNSTTTQYQVYRKLKTATSWGSSLATLNGSTTTYADNSVSVGENYEYRVSRSGSGYVGHGYINSGIEVPEISYRGKLILMVDSSFLVALSSELARLVADIEGDGWEVIRHDVLRTGSVTHIKELIVNDFIADTSLNTKAVFLVGHIPVPYSGNINPDGHSDHLGAWPADCYYGDIDGNWTDSFVTSTTASPVRTQNNPGDGKFDQSVIPGDLELQVGRVDFNDMPAFSSSEQQLLKEYLDKDHAYRKKLFSPLKQAVVDDNFGYFGSEAFAASGYKNFAPLVGVNNVTNGDYFTSMTGTTYAWSYGCGGGSFTSASGIGSTSNFASANLEGVFTMLFGSYFGDWDSQNNFLKAPLAQGKILTSVWSGRPHYQFHHMGLGENIGYSVLQTQNNPGNLYYASPTAITGRWVHNALMGDPTLRNDVISPVSNVVATKVGYNCHISWSASTEPNSMGYNIYMKNDTNSTYTKLNVLPVTATSYTDNCLQYKGVYTYMVRTLKLENVPGGTYYNMSEGISDTAYNANPAKVYAGFTTSLLGSQINFTNTSTGAINYFWDFGDGQTSIAINPSITYSLNNLYVITLIAGNPCDQDTTYHSVQITVVGLKEFPDNKAFKLFPNPGKGIIKISFEGEEVVTLEIYNTEGKLVSVVDTLSSGQEINLEALPKGLYLARINTATKPALKKFVIE